MKRNPIVEFDEAMYEKDMHRMRDLYHEALGKIAQIVLSFDEDTERLRQFAQAVLDDNEDTAGASTLGLALKWQLIDNSQEDLSGIVWRDIQTMVVRKALGLPVEKIVIVAQSDATEPPAPTDAGA